MEIGYPQKERHLTGPEPRPQTIPDRLPDEVTAPKPEPVPEREKVPA